jgi:hypothetical protein
MYAADFTYPVFSKKAVVRCAILDLVDVYCSELCSPLKLEAVVVGGACAIHNIRPYRHLSASAHGPRKGPQCSEHLAAKSALSGDDWPVVTCTSSLHRNDGKVFNKLKD